MADIDEVRKLYAEFQRVQQTSATQRLSEHNVIELMNKLVELKMIEVLYTSDGKEYVTPQHLTKEIRDELIVHGGRVNLVDLQQTLNVDLSHIEARVNDMVRHDRHLTLILGQLIDSSYRDKLGEEMNDLLQEQGHITIAEVAKAYDLPPDFVREVVEEKLGKVIKGQMDSQDTDIVFTNSFVARMTAKIRGAFSAITIPVAVGAIRMQTGCQEQLFHKLLEELLKQGRLCGSMSGGRQDKSVFYPEVYSRAQYEWMDSFYKHNGYLEYDALIRLGVSDVLNTIKKRFKDEKLVMLKSSCVGSTIMDRITASVEDALASNSWVDIKTLLPSSFSNQDSTELLSQVLRSHHGVLVCADTIAASQAMITEAAKSFTNLIQQKAEKAVQQNPAMLKGEVEKPSGKSAPSHEDTTKDDKKEQRRKKAQASGKKEGTGGREIKTKSTKKKNARGRDVDDDMDDDAGVTASASSLRHQELSFMEVSEIQKVLQGQEALADCPEALLKDIAVQLYKTLNRQYQEAAKSIFLQTSGTGTSAGRRKNFGELQDKVSGLWTNAHMFEKGLKLLADVNQVSLARHLLKTLCTDITNLLVNAIATDNMLSVSDPSQQTPESRMKLIGNLPQDVQKPLLRLHQSLSKDTLDEFFTTMEQFCTSIHMGMTLKKPDKHKERQLAFAHRQLLAEQLKVEQDVAMALHLASVILFQTFTQAMVHVPGRMVPALVAFLQPLMQEGPHATLVQCQDLVVQRLQAQNTGDQGSVEALTSQLNLLLPQVKDIALTTKKKTQENDDL